MSAASERPLDEHAVAYATEAATIVVDQAMSIEQRFRAAHSITARALSGPATDEQRWTFLAVLAGIIGQVLRPDGHPGGPIGPAQVSLDRVAVVDHRDERALDDRALWLASLLIGAGATRDPELCGDLADVALNGPHPRITVMRVARAMLETLIELPIEEAPQENP